MKSAIPTCVRPPCAAWQRRETTSRPFTISLLPISTCASEPPRPVTWACWYYAETKPNKGRIPLRLFSAGCGSLKKREARLGIISVTPKTAEEIQQLVAAAGNFANAPIVSLVGGGPNDPLGLRQQLALKLVLNAHSTALMAKLGRLIGNTMTFVSPSNLKLIGRATFLIQSHVNDTLGGHHWQEVRGSCRPLSYAEANVLLCSAKEFVKNREDAEAAEVALAIIRALEALKRQAFVSWEEALVILKTQGLSDYLSALNSPWPDREVP